MRAIGIGVLVAALTTAACGGKKDDGAGSGGGAGKVDAKAELAAVAGKPVADANAQIPEELAGKLEFVAVLGEDDEHVAVQPKGWEGTNKGMPDRVQPPEAAGLGFMTSYSTGSNCDGACEPKDWPATAEKVDFAQFKGQDYTIVKDETQGTSRVLVARTVDRTYVAYATWKQGAKRYFTCRATLDQEIAVAAPAFEAACRAMKVVAWN